MKKLLTIGIIMMSFYFVGLAFGSVHSNDTIVAPEVNTCTVDQFKQVANDSYRPWSERRTERKLLRNLKQCAVNDTTRRLMIKYEAKLAHHRSKIIRLYHEWTPFTAGPGRWAIPYYAVLRESGGNCHVISSFSGGGCYGILQQWWDVYAPSKYKGLLPPSWPKLIQHHVAHEIYLDNGAGGWSTFKQLITNHCKMPRGFAPISC